MTASKVDIVIKSFSRDYWSLTYLLQSISLFVTGYRTLYLFLDPEDSYPPYIESITPLVKPNWIIQRASVCVRPGYIQQQLYKLNVASFSDADYILPLDADMIFFRHSDLSEWFSGDKAFIPYLQWSNSAISYPPLSLHTRLIAMGLEVRHSIDQMIDIIIENSDEAGCKNSTFSDGKLTFNYQGSRYSLDRNMPHSVWLSSIRQITDSPIDSMRAHYVFSKQGLERLQRFTIDFFGVSLEEAVDDSNLFPVFSEYQYYGNVMQNFATECSHVMVGYPDYFELTAKLPVIKCNSRQASACEVYKDIISGLYREWSDRTRLLDHIRSSRSSINSLEDWC